MSNVVQIADGCQRVEQFKQEIASTLEKIESIYQGLVLHGVVQIDGTEYTMHDVIQHLLQDPRARAELQQLLVQQLDAEGDEIDPAVSRVNRFLITSARCWAAEQLKKRK